MDVQVKVEGDLVVVKTPYLPAFVNELKKLIPSKERKFDRGKSAWIVTLNNREIVERLVAKYFSELEEALLVAIANGNTPYVGGIGLIWYGRDGHRGTSGEMAHVVEAVRVGNTGSRNYPRWYGYVLARVHVNPDILIKAYRYRLFENTPDNLELLQDFVKQLAEKCGDDLDAAAEELEKLNIRELQVNKNGEVIKVFNALDEFIGELEEIAIEASRKEEVVRMLTKVKKELERELKRVNGLLECLNA